MKKNSKIYVAGHRGMVGSAIVRQLENQGYTNIIKKTHKELDLCSQQQVIDFFKAEQPEYVFLAAAKVGGIMANMNAPATFLYENICIQNNVIHTAYEYNVKKLMFLGSSCIYPRNCPQPMKEEYLLTGLLEPTNEGYAIAKISGIKMCESYRKQYNADFISVMPCNLYGIGDNFNLQNSHFIPALIRKFHEAKVSNSDNVVVWGTGKPKREVLFADDMALACIHLMDNYSESLFLNIGSGVDHTIEEIALTIKKIVGFTGGITYDTTKPDGMPQKLMDITKITETDWKPDISLEQGLTMTYQWFLENKENLDRV